MTVPSDKKYIEVARHYLAAVRHLCTVQDGNLIAPMGLLASQTAELALKAYLLHKGKTEKELKAIGHDLSEAWCSAKALGLKAAWEVGFSIDVLSISHDSPYLFRYPKAGVAVAITDPEVLCDHLEAIVSEVENCVDAHHTRA